METAARPVPAPGRGVSAHRPAGEPNGHPAGGMAGMAAIARIAPRGNPRRFRRAPTRPAFIVVLPRPHGVAVSVARRTGTPPAAAGGADHHRTSAHAADPVEKPGAVGNPAHPVSGPECQPFHLGAARGASVAAFPGAIVSGAFRHPIAERRRLLYREP